VTRNRADDVNAFWLPSGERIVFNRAAANDLEIHPIEPDGTGIRGLTANQVEDDLVRNVISRRRWRVHAGMAPGRAARSLLRR
jgi:hypothetical protein